MQLMIRCLFNYRRVSQDWKKREFCCSMLILGSLSKTKLALYKKVSLFGDLNQVEGHVNLLVNWNNFIAFSEISNLLQLASINIFPRFILLSKVNLFSSSFACIKREPLMIRKRYLSYITHSILFVFCSVQQISLKIYVLFIAQ